MHYEIVYNRGCCFSPVAFATERGHFSSTQDVIRYAQVNRVMLGASGYEAKVLIDGEYVDRSFKSNRQLSWI